MTGARLDSSYHDVLDSFESLWRNKNLPSDARLLVCGAVYRAGQKQGDEVFSRDIFRAIENHDELTPQDMLEMVEGVHDFVLNKKKLRVQYLTIVLNQLTSYLTQHYQHLAKEFERKLAEASARN